MKKMMRLKSNTNHSTRTIEPLIEMKGVKKKYKSGVIALQDINISIKPGEFVYVIGSTGAGKSTFIKLLDGEEKATSGEIRVKEFQLHKMFKHQLPKYRRNIGVVYQDFKLLERKTVYENIYLACEVYRMGTKESRVRTREVLKMVGLLDKSQSYPDELSGGEQQRVAIGRAIASRPILLIADEPTGNLDPSTSKEIIEILLDINKTQGATVIIVTHDENVVNDYKQRTISIKNGLLAADRELGGYLV